MARPRKRSILVLGSTGSIGRSALEVIREHPRLFTVAALAARGSVETFVEQVREFRPKAAALLDPKAAAEAQASLRGVHTEIRSGVEGILSLFEDPGADTALVGIAGAAGLSSTVEAVRRGMRVALANKESLVMAGPQLLAAAKRSGASILPVDSEHSAVAQALLSGRREEVRRVLLTASGGALRDLPLGRLRDARPADALRHPTWKMGRRITIDSATLMNKTLEIVEAVHLFGVPPERVEVLLHRQSVVHSMVEFRDGSVLAQMGRPDMKLPILWALAHPDRPDSPGFRLEVADIARLDFAAPDPVRYPALALGWRAARDGGTAGAVLNAADERAVDLFLAGRIRFTDIAPLVEAAMDAVPPGKTPRGESLGKFLARAAAADAAARRAVDERARRREDRVLMVLAGLLGEIGSWTQVILGVGLLVFIHEMGHFLVAKWAGVRVLTFSLGFGREIWGFTRGSTRYRVSVVPLGGYVKMSGETELPEGGYAPDDYPSAPVWKRSLIIVAGVAMNAVLGFGLFAAAVVVGFRDLPPVLGSVALGSSADVAGLRPGDRVLSADGEHLLLFTDLQYASMGGKTLDLEVDRGGSLLRVKVTPRKEPEAPVPAIGVTPDLGEVLDVPAESEAAKAGFRAGDRIVSVEGLPCSLNDLLRDPVLAVAAFPASGPVRIGVLRDGKEVALRLVRKETAPRIGIGPFQTTADYVRAGGAAERAGWRVGDRPVAVGGRAVGGWRGFLRAAVRAEGSGTLAVRVARDGTEVDLPFPDDDAGRLALLRDLRAAKPESKTAVEVMPEGLAPPEGGRPAPSPAASAGIPPGAVLRTVAGTPVADFEGIVRAIEAQEGKPFEVSWTAGGGKGSAVVTPAPYARDLLPRIDLPTVVPEEEVRTANPAEAARLAWKASLRTTRQIVATVTGIFGGSVDKSNLGGPILIATVAHRSSKQGFGAFLWLLAGLSINLMFVNILPIPLLDGGQLALLAAEAVMRKPPSELAVGIAQTLGLVFVLGLLLLVTFNDVARLIGR